jgi:hypothetical protein
VEEYWRHRCRSTGPRRMGAAEFVRWRAGFASDHVEGGRRVIVDGGSGRVPVVRRTTPGAFWVPSASSRRGPQQLGLMISQPIWYAKEGWGC